MTIDGLTREELDKRYSDFLYKMDSIRITYEPDNDSFIDKVCQYVRNVIGKNM